jgi:anthranilate/para-aminobenzoate synthase component I
MIEKPWVQLASSRAQPDWSFKAAAPSLVLSCDAREPKARGLTTLADASGIRSRWNDPIAALAWLDENLRQGAFPAQSRWIGYISYDLVRLFESIGNRASDDLSLPLFALSLHNPDNSPSRPPELPIGKTPLRSTFTRSGFESAVIRTIDYIKAGDVFQVNLSQRFSCGATAQPREIFDRLQAESPALYGACICYNDFALVSNSPELFLRVTPNPDNSRTIIARPIKGTRPRAPGMEGELRHSSKDQAELNMIIDVERNDLGRICQIGTVKVAEPRAIEEHPTVYHGVATVEGKLRPDVTLVDLLRATFPTGSVTGAPKIRAMQIIDELEPVRRGPYCGAIGYVAADGRIELSVAIRTMIFKDGQVHIPVGGGIVADSGPAAEYEETLVKARAMFAALDISPPESSVA